MYDPIIGRFISPDSIVQDWYDPQALNRYAYCRNNPLKYVDPDGHAWDIVDIGFFAQSAYTFARNPSWANAGWLLADTVSLAPIVPSLGYARVAKKIVGTVADAASNANKADNSAKSVKALGNAPKKVTREQRWKQLAEEGKLSKQEIDYVQKHGGTGMQDTFGKELAHKPGKPAVQGNDFSEAVPKLEVDHRGLEHRYLKERKTGTTISMPKKKRSGGKLDLPKPGALP